VRLDGVRGGFEGSLAHLRYYTRALSPIHVRIVCDQGPPHDPAANPVFDLRCYQALADLQLVAATPLATPHLAQPAWLQLLFACVMEGTSRVQQAALRLLRRVLPHTQPSKCCLSWGFASNMNRGLMMKVGAQEEIVGSKQQEAEEKKVEEEKHEGKQEENEELHKEKKTGPALSLAEYLLHVLGLSVWRAELHPNMAHAKIPLEALPRNLVDACSAHRDTTEHAPYAGAQYGGDSVESQPDSSHDFEGMLGGDGFDDNGETALSSSNSACLTPDALAEVILLGEEVALLLRALLNHSGDAWGAHVATTMGKAFSDLTAFMNEGLPAHAQSTPRNPALTAAAAEPSHHEVTVVGANKGEDDVLGALRRDAAILGLASVNVLSPHDGSCNSPGGVQPGSTVTASLNNGNSQATVLLMDSATNVAHVCLHPPPAIAQFNGTAPDLPPLHNKNNSASSSASSSLGIRPTPKSLKIGRVAIDELVLVQDIHEPGNPGCSIENNKDGSGVFPGGSNSNVEASDRMTSLVTHSFLPLLDRLLALGHPPFLATTTANTPPATGRHHHSPPDNVRWRVRGLYHAQLTTRCLAVGSDIVDQGVWLHVAKDRPQLLQRLLSLATEVNMNTFRHTSRL